VGSRRPCTSPAAGNRNPALWSTRSRQFFLRRSRLDRKPFSPANLAYRISQTKGIRAAHCSCTTANRHLRVPNNGTSQAARNDRPSSGPGSALPRIQHVRTGLEPCFGSGQAECRVAAVGSRRLMCGVRAPLAPIAEIPHAQRPRPGVLQIRGHLHSSALGSASGVAKGPVSASVLTTLRGRCGAKRRPARVCSPLTPVAIHVPTDVSHDRFEWRCHDLVSTVLVSTVGDGRSGACATRPAPPPRHLAALTRAPASQPRPDPRGTRDADPDPIPRKPSATTSSPAAQGRGCGPSWRHAHPRTATPVAGNPHSHPMQRRCGTEHRPPRPFVPHCPRVWGNPALRAASCPTPARSGGTVGTSAASVGRTPPTASVRPTPPAGVGQTGAQGGFLPHTRPVWPHCGDFCRDRLAAAAILMNDAASLNATTKARSHG
jgi:hypothetical protein